MLMLDFDLSRPTFIVRSARHVAPILPLQLGYLAHLSSTETCIGTEITPRRVGELGERAGKRLAPLTIWARPRHPRQR